jgi:RimJ/RimL family protein N-acetyltransferase
LKLRELKQEDIDFVKDHSISRTIFDKQPEQTDFRWTLEDDGEIVGIGGIQLINLATAWCWIDLAEKAEEKPLLVIKTLKDMMSFIVEKWKLKRLEAYVETDFEKARNFIEFLDFEYESTMKNFCGEKDAYLYRKIF